MCDNPFLAWKPGTKNPKTGNDVIKFIPRRFDMSYADAKSKFGDRLVLIPCGRCPSCLKDYALQWTVRLIAESLYQEQKCFLTLTYDQSHLPQDKKLCKRDLQLFFKRLRKAYPDNKIRYFACGEYGDLNGRPHYHVILFGLDFDDKKWISDNNLRNHLYTSDKLRSIWSLGQVSIGSFTSQSCGYVARYSLKKRISFEHSDEFIVMSRKPPIGYQYFIDHKDEMYISDKLYIPELGAVKIPRYYDKVMSQSDDVLDNYFYELAKQLREKRCLTNSDLFMGAYGFTHKEDEQVFRVSQGVSAMKSLRRSI